jgi:hypothetical protein
MDAEVSRIIAAILHVSRKSGALHTRDAAVTANAIRVACAYWERTERRLVTPDLKEAPGWTGYEMKCFQLGRALELVMKKLDVWLGPGEVLDACAEILAEPRYGRGRQSFAATLGEHGQSAYAAPLVAALSDEAMAGYAIKALNQGQYGTYVNEVRAAGEAGRPWVRNAALAYIAKFDPSRVGPPANAAQEA